MQIYSTKNISRSSLSTTSKTMSTNGNNTTLKYPHEKAPYICINRRAKRYSCMISAIQIRMVQRCARLPFPIGTHPVSFHSLPWLQLWLLVFFIRTQSSGHHVLPVVSSPGLFHFQRSTCTLAACWVREFGDQEIGTTSVAMQGSIGYADQSNTNWAFHPICANASAHQ